MVKANNQGREKQEDSKEQKESDEESTEEKEESRISEGLELSLLPDEESEVFEDLDAFEEGDEDMEFSSRFSSSGKGGVAPVLPQDENSFDSSLEDVTQDVTTPFNPTSVTENPGDSYSEPADTNYQFSQYEENQARQYANDRAENAFDPTGGLIVTDNLGFEDRGVDMSGLPGTARGMNTRRSELEDFQTEQKKYQEKIEEDRKLPFEKKRR